MGIKIQKIIYIANMRFSNEKAHSYQTQILKIMVILLILVVRLGIPFVIKTEIFKIYVIDLGPKFRDLFNIFGLTLLFYQNDIF